jgi:hypothetical protein
MRFTDARVFNEERFSVGTEEDSGRHDVSNPVSNGLVDYEEYFEIDAAALDLYCREPAAAAAVVERCRRRELDHLLLMKPGRNRGVPT